MTKHSIVKILLIFPLCTSEGVVGYLREEFPQIKYLFFSQ